MKLYRLNGPAWGDSHYTTAALSVDVAIEQISKFLEGQIDLESKHGTPAMKNLRQDELSRIREWAKNGYTLEIKELTDVLEGTWP